MTIFEKLSRWYATQVQRHQLVTKQDLRETKNEIMATVKEYTDSVNTVFAKMNAAVDKANTGLDAVAGDIKKLQDTLNKIQNSPGTLTPQDQASLDESLKQASSLATRVDGVADALSQLDTVTNTPPAPPVEQPPSSGPVDSGTTDAGAPADTAKSAVKQK